MNILYVVFTFKTGGIQRLLADTINKLVDNNNVYLCVINNSYDQSMLNAVSKKAKIILLNRQESGEKIKYIIEYTKLIIQNKIDVIHCQLENSVKLSALAKIINPKIKVLTTVHETNSFIHLKWYEVLIDRMICKKIIAVSDCVKNEMMLRGIPEKKIVTIYNAIDLEKFNYLDKTRKRKKKKRIIIGNVSRFVLEKKGQDILIEAIAKLKESYNDILCLFAGECGNENPQDINKMIKVCKEKNISNNVRFLGNVINISKFLDNIDIFVLPSRHEAFGIALVEAMAKGVPCIASDVEGPKEILKDGQYGLLFKNEDADDLAQKIEYRIKNREFEKEKISDYINQNYSINSMIGQLLEVYRN